MAKEMQRIEMVVGADGTFGVVIDGKMRNAKIDRDTGKVEWISFPKGPKNEHLREACSSAATWLVGLLPRV